MSSKTPRPDRRCFEEKKDRPANCVRRGQRMAPVREPYGKQAVALRGIFQLAKARLNATFTVPLT